MIWRCPSLYTWIHSLSFISHMFSNIIYIAHTCTCVHNWPGLSMSSRRLIWNDSFKFWSCTSCVSRFIGEVVTRGKAKNRLWRIPQGRRQSQRLLLKSTMKEISQKGDPKTLAEPVHTNLRGTAKEDKRNCFSSSTCSPSARLHAIVCNNFACKGWHASTLLLGQARAWSLTSLHNISSNEYLLILPCPLNISLYYGIQPQTGRIHESNGIYASNNNIVSIFMIHII